MGKCFPVTIWVQLHTVQSLLWPVLLSKCFQWGTGLECRQTSLTNSIIWVFLLWCVQNVQKVTHLCHLDGRIIHCKAYISYVNGALKNNSKTSNILCKEYTHWQQCVYSFQTFTFLLSFLFVNDVFGEPRSPSFSVISSLLFFSSCLSFSSSFFLTSTSSYLFKIGRK